MKSSARDRVRRVGIYVRISDDREGGGLGVKRQEDDCRLLAASLGWKVVEVYVDNDVTAADRRKKRKDYLRMLEDVKSGHIDAIVGWHPDRLYRQPVELEDLILIVEEHKTEIRTVTAGELDLNTPTGRLIARTLGNVAKFEVEHKRERILRKVQELVEAGKIHNGGHRPFGYTRLYDGEGTRRKVLGEILNEEEAAYVKRWAARALSGEKLYSLVLDAQENGVKTTTGGEFTYQAMRALLMSARISGRKEHKGEIKGQAVWPKIIEPEDSDSLRALLDERSEEFKAEFGERDSTALKYPLSGLPRCTCKVPHVVGQPCSCKEEGRQHHKMSTGQRGDKDMPIYTCKKEGGGCGGRTIQIPDLEPLVEKLLFKRLEEIEVSADEDPDDPRPELDAKLVRWEKRKSELADELLDGDRPAREIQDAIDKLNVRMADARQKIAQYGVKANLTEVSAAELRKEWEDYSVARKQSVYRGLIREILIHPATRPFNVWNPDRVEILWR
ncbi:recombinase family protein [Streptomyces sp. RK23]|uniref:recombinase family protein n=1 Tax=unclassified Streptomyces TaxID=2593676 RepID=UPI001B370CD6|nr:MULTISPECIES: recombinase family protein [unclassified Streptomyces]MBQ0969190.1 recombinase family protein [Streptomyces sp. RK74B]MBQ1004771.1 recombinase family protein [Streptomyces sp. RK23]